MGIVYSGIYTYIQWNLSTTDSLGTKIISEVSLFQGENIYIKL